MAPSGFVRAARFVAASVEVEFGALVAGRFVLVLVFEPAGFVVGTDAAGRESSRDSAALPPPLETVVTVLPPLPTNEMLDLNSAVQVLASTAPVTGRPMRCWKRETAPRVIGPKIPSSSTPTSRWTAATASPVSPYETSEFDGSSIADRCPEDPDEAVAIDRGPLPEAAAANGAAVGPAAIEAVTAIAAPFRRAACLRASSVISRRWTDRRSERSQSSKSLRSRL